MTAALRVLVVDDDHEMADLVAEALTDAGYQATPAYSGFMACDLAATLLPHVVLLDLTMPLLDGFATLARMRTVPGVGGAAFVALTGHTRPEDAQRTIAAGFTMHLGKPISVEALFDAINRVAKEASGRLAVPSIDDDHGPSEVGR